MPTTTPKHIGTTMPCSRAGAKEAGRGKEGSRAPAKKERIRRSAACLVTTGVLIMGAILLRGGNPAGGAPGGAEKPARARVLRLPSTPYHYADVELPARYQRRGGPAARQHAADNPVTDAGATLGRVLFYDTRLSVNGPSRAAPATPRRFAFSDPRPFSKGYDGRAHGPQLDAAGRARFYSAAASSGTSAPPPSKSRS